jgi:hypothetical protein
MANNAEWTAAYARQAEADLNTYDALTRIQALDRIPDCHVLQFLQMACEKLVKAALCCDPIDPKSLQKSHDYVAKTLPVVFKHNLALLGYRSRKDAQGFQELTRHLAQEINLLAPAVKRVGKRPDNCEYPWEDGTGKLHTPLTHSFSVSQLLFQKHGPAFLRMLSLSVNKLLS